MNTAFRLLPYVASLAALVVCLSSSPRSEPLPATEPSVTLREDDFPLRKKYPELKCLSTEQFISMMSVAIIVDARNAVEYDVIHIEGSVSIPATSMTVEELEAIRAKDAKRPIVFYCNGHTCTKSYKGCKKAVDFGFDNVFVYDAGVLTFATVKPEQTVFFGKPMSRKTVSSQLISKEKFKAISISPAAFVELAREEGYQVFDLRDRDERAKHPIELPGVIGGSIDEFVAWLEQPGQVPASKILLMDWVGKQVKWAHYYLLEHGRADFYFLDGGVKRWLDEGRDAHGNRSDAKHGE